LRLHAEPHNIGIQSRCGKLISRLPNRFYTFRFDLKVELTTGAIAQQRLKFLVTSNLALKGGPPSGPFSSNHISVPLLQIFSPFLKIGIDSFRRTNGGAGLPPPLMTESLLRSA
jgi:hypothetical protein